MVSNSSLIAVPNQTMYQNGDANDVTPVPEDAEKMDYYIQDRRVIGVSFHFLHHSGILSLHPLPLQCVSKALFPVLALHANPHHHISHICQIRQNMTY